jgi:hypothetical protein
MNQKFVIPFWVFIALWFAAILLPFAASFALPIAGAAIGILLPVLWLRLMPVSCMGGAFIAFPMALVQIGSGMGWLLLGIRLLTR